jgi:hypothetical protein
MVRRTSRAAGQRRPAVVEAERYPTFLNYQLKVRRAFDRMVRQRLFLCEDADAERTRLYANGVALGVPAPQAGLPAPDTAATLLEPARPQR